MFKIGIIAKYWNEEILLPNWLRWLTLINADYIYLADDGSTDSSAKICEMYTHRTAIIQNSTLEPPHEKYFENTTPEGTKINQLLANAYTDGCDWVIHLDIDEFPTIPMIEFINNTLPKLIPEFGIYFSICDLSNSISNVIVQNIDTGYFHFPCPHLKIFGKHSQYTRIVNGLKLDQGVEGGRQYIMTTYPYIHLKYAFKHRRWIRGDILGGTKFQPSIHATVEQIPPSFIPDMIRKWYYNFTEPEQIW